MGLGLELGLGLGPGLGLGLECSTQTEPQNGSSTSEPARTCAWLAIRKARSAGSEVRLRW